MVRALSSETNNTAHLHPPVCVRLITLSCTAVSLSFSMSGTTSDHSTSSSGTPDTTPSLIDISDAPVGLSDPQYVQRKRNMLDAVNRLRAIG